MRSPKPPPPIVDASRNLSNKKRFDRTRPTRDSPARAGRRNQATAQDQAATPHRRRPGTASPPHPRDHHRPRAGMASTTPATTPPHPGRKRQPARKPGTPRQNPRPGSQHQSAESGQSQEPPPDEPDIKAYTGPKQSRPSEQPSFRITAVTCLYRHCPVTVRESRNHMTNVVLAADPVVPHAGRVRDARVKAGELAAATPLHGSRGGLRSARTIQRCTARAGYSGCLRN